MRILDMINRSAPPVPWSQGDNIPWNDPDFSDRMLCKHLSQDHDLASRRVETIDRQVNWIHEHVLRAAPTRILDLACGPGLYGSRLAELGHHYRGIDYSPASVAHARHSAAGNERHTYIEGDIRRAEFGDGYGLVMLVYGEFNVFRRADAGEILGRAHSALQPGGRILLEPHTHAGVLSICDRDRTWESLEAGLFSDDPHLCLKRAHWDDPTQTATLQFFVIDAATADVTRSAVSYQAYSHEQYRALLADHGFEAIEIHPSLTGDKTPADPKLMAILARKPE